jgi:hypothetical protein
VPSRGQRLSGLLDLSALPSDAVERLTAAEDAVYRDPCDPLSGWDERSLAADAAAVGLVVATAEIETATGPRRVRSEDLDRWFAGPWGDAISRVLAADDLGAVRREALARLAGHDVPWLSATLYLTASKPGS